jgi:hypothetical protein
VTKSEGFCGYIGGSGDELVTGFDDGYTFMGYLQERGWRALHGKGNWPYVVVLRYVAEPGRHVLARYIEADFTVWIADTPEALRAGHAALPDAP